MFSYCARQRYAIRSRIKAQLLVAIGVALLLQYGCATPHTPAVWIGATFAELEQAFGDPEAVFINNQHNRVYVFRPAPVESNATEHDTKLLYGEGELALADAQCAILFELAERTVTRWDWYQPGCETADFPLPYQVGALQENRRQ